MSKLQLNLYLLNLNVVIYSKLRLYSFANRSLAEVVVVDTEIIY